MKVTNVMHIQPDEEGGESLKLWDSGESVVVHSPDGGYHVPYAQIDELIEVLKTFKPEKQDA